MTCDAHCNQILFRIIAALATKFLVVNLQVRSAPAALAFPAITAQYLLPESFVQLRIETLARAFG